MSSNTESKIYPLLLLVIQLTALFAVIRLKEEERDQSE
jgi:hypothetical protein